ncbi:MAG: hypothetical protein ACRCV9_16340 [Burkholderiaceae bacterium]
MQIIINITDAQHHALACQLPNVQAFFDNFVQSRVALACQELGVGVGPNGDPTDAQLEAMQSKPTAAQRIADQAREDAARLERERLAADEAEQQARVQREEQAAQNALKYKDDVRKGVLEFAQTPEFEALLAEISAKKTAKPEA